MLPPRLKRLRDRLEAKGVAKRTTGEDELLKELKAIDSDVKKLSESFETRMTSGPATSCDCCGRAL